ncbi:MAG: DUF5689 domain-containing protein [Phocaeicola sp.]
MKRFNSIYLFLTMLFALSFVSCVNDNDDTEAPFLKVTPSVLLFGNNGEPQPGSQNHFEVATNRSWTATVVDNKSWVTLSKAAGEGDSQVEVNIPEGITDEATVLIQISNKIGVLKTETVTIKSGEVVPSELLYNETMGTASISSPWPLVADYTDWAKTGSAASAVTYSGTNTSLRSSGISNSGAYPGASGPNVVFFGGVPATYTVSKIALIASQTNLKLNFGGSRSKQDGAVYDNIFKTENFDVELSANGTSWKKISYTKNDGDAEHPFWIYATADFTLKTAVSELYIRFTAKEPSVYRLDDITLGTGNGGQVVDLDGEDPDPTDAVVITIPELLGMIGPSPVVVDEKDDRFFEAIVMSDVAGGNTTNNNLVVATEGATTSKNGITLYGSQVNPSTLGLNRGDKVKITLTRGLAKAQLHKGLYQVTGSAADAWAKVEKIGTGNVNPITITMDQMDDFQAMPVNIENATTATAGVWANSTGISSHVLTVNGSNLTVFCQKNAASLLNVSFKATTATITGLVSAYNDNLQLVPRDATDVANFNGSSDVPTITVNPTSVRFDAIGGTKTVEVTVTNQGENTLSISSLSDILSASLNDKTITIVATENSETTAVSQSLTVSLSDGTNVVLPITVAANTGGDVTNVAMTSQDIVEGASGDIQLALNAYGSQSVNDPTTWYTWVTTNLLEFSGVRMCVAPDNNGGGIQIQGNATDLSKQGRMTNVTSLGSIQSMTIVLRVVSTTPNDPNYNIYAGTEANPWSSDTKIAMTNSAVTEADGFRTYTQTYDFSTGDYSYFTIANDLVGALYIDSIDISYK